MCVEWGRGSGRQSKTYTKYEKVNERGRGGRERDSIQAQHNYCHSIAMGCWLILLIRLPHT